MPTKQDKREFQFELSGGNLALDFANTVSRRDDAERSTDHISGYRDLVAFAEQSQLITRPEAEKLRREAEASDGLAAQVFRNAITLREALFRSFSRAASGKAASAEDVAIIESSNADALRHRRIARVHNSYLWKWEEGSDLERILWPVAQAAADLLVSTDLAKVRECEASDCAWLFLDSSRNHSRRWCDMTVCGNREKARRHYQRQRAES